MYRKIFNFVRKVYPLVLLVLATLVFFEPSSSLKAQTNSQNFIHYQTSDGLPSSEVYYVMQDRHGYMWFATDNGVARFDGYEFRVYGTADGLDDTVVFTIIEDERGRIWCGGFSAQLFYLEDDRFHPYEHNDVLRRIKNNSWVTYLVDVEPEGIVLLANKLGLISVNNAGEISWLGRLDRDDRILYRPGGEPNDVYTQKALVWAPIFGEDVFPEIQVADRDTLRVVDLDIDTTQLAARSGYLTATQLGEKPEDGLILTNNTDNLFLGPWGARLLNHPGGGIINILKTPAGDILYMIREKGVAWGTFNVDSTSMSFVRYLDGTSPTMGAWDRDGGLWITTLEAGVFYLPQPERRVYSVTVDGIPQKAFSVLQMDEDHVYSGHRSGRLYVFQTKTDSVRQVAIPLGTNEHDNYDLYFDERTGQILISSLSFKPATANQLESDIRPFALNDTERVQIPYVNRFELAPNGKIRYNGSLDYGYIDAENAVMQVKHLTHGRVETIYGIGGFVTLSDGRVLVGTSSGLQMELPDGRYVNNDLGVEALNQRIVRIIDLGEDRLLIGTRGKGLVVRTPDTIYVVNTNDGLASDLIRNLHYGDDEYLYVSTFEGLSKISFNADLTLRSLRTFTVANGLVNNEIHDVDTYGDNVWLATSVGVVQFFESSIDTSRAPPAILEMTWDSTTATLRSGYEFGPAIRDFTIRYNYIDYQAGGEINYRYRINSQRNWNTTRNREATYTDLPPGDYRFEVQRQNRDGLWSRSAYLPLSISTHWYETWWARVLFGGLLVGMVTLIFLQRERRKRQAREIELQVNKLEHAALHAQMNPHFVFNALNSIQNFVLQNETQEAATYLAKFAGLIRQTLRSSVEGEHNLESEIQMLQVYLDLEKLRFKDRFNYEIKVDPGLPRQDVFLPPLLVQPFVENAILHGMKNDLHRGMILIHFGGRPEELLLTVRDNGVGFDPDITKEKDSMGMDITRRRLQLIGRLKKKETAMRVQPVLNEWGQPTGTRVELRIRTRIVNAARELAPKSNQ